MQRSHIIFGTVVRNAPVRKGGELVWLDWGKKRVEKKIDIFPEHPSLDHDPNPQGNSRGCRGIQIIGNEIVAASYHTLKVFNQNLNFVRNISDGLMVGLHETYHEGKDKKIWVTSTAIDAAIEYHLDSGAISRYFWPREMKSFQKSLNLTPKMIEKNTDQRKNFLGTEHIKDPSHLHLNAVAKWKDHIYVLFNAFGIIADLTEQRIIIQDDALRGGHNLFIMENGIVVSNDTYGRKIRFYNLEKRCLFGVIDLMNFKPIKYMENVFKLKNTAWRILEKLRLARMKTARPIFLRGLDFQGELLFAGISPASILCINWKKKELIDFFSYKKDVRECVHGLKVVP